MRRVVRVIVLSLLGALLVAGPVNAGAPQIEKVPVDEQFHDDFLSAACGVDVTTHLTGHSIHRTFTDADGNPVHEVNNYAFTWTFSSENGQIVAHDVGADRVTYLDDGSLIVIIIGNVQSFSIPGQGRAHSDVGRSRLEITFDENGDPSFELTPLSGHHDENAVDAICSVLG